MLNVTVHVILVQMDNVISVLVKIVLVLTVTVKNKNAVLKKEI